MVVPTSLQGRVAVVTGGSRGIGRAIAERFGHAGARVVVAATRQDRIDATCQELARRGVACSGMACDVADLDQVRALLQHALTRWGKVDIWVNNAGISGPFGPALAIDPAEWQRVLAVNVLGSYHGCVVALPHMRERGYGKIINVSGGGAKRAQRYLSAYSTSKAAIVRMSEAFARDYAGEKGIAINVLAPGMVPTDMLSFHDARGAGATKALEALPRVLRIFGTTCEETAELALKLASPATDKVSGKVFEVMPRRRVLWRLAQATLGRR
jgi:NAD(P)-dependent dehydrogenase (short-subunit alcohol dehydrogenase family)